MTRNGLAALLCLAITVALAWALIERPVPDEHLPLRVDAAMSASGVAHPVTAVLLNFRSFDTLLEAGVLLLAAVVALALREAQPDRPDRMGLDNPLLRAVMAWLLPLMLLVAGYLLWAGSTRPGGAFQSGAVLAAAGVLLRLAGVTLPGFDKPWLLRAALVAGMAAFLGIGTVAMYGGRPLLAYPAPLAGALIIVIEGVLALSIGLALLSLFKLAPPHATAAPNPEDPQGEHGDDRMNPVDKPALSQHDNQRQTGSPVNGQAHQGSVPTPDGTHPTRRSSSWIPRLGVPECAPSRQATSGQPRNPGS